MAADNHAGRAFSPAFQRAGAGSLAVWRHLVDVLGGRARTRVIMVLACVLALSSADTATVGASAIQLRRALGIDNTDIGLLVTTTSVVGAVFSLPSGFLADRVRRTWMLAVVIVTWGAAMIWSATAGSFGQLLVARLFLGAVTAAGGPAVASLVGDWFPGAERGRVYSYILTGELVGAGVGFSVTGNVATLSWRAAFLVLALPALTLAWVVFRLPEPARGGRGALAFEPAPSSTAEPAAAGTGAGRLGGRGRRAGLDAQQLARERGVAPDARLVDKARPDMGFVASLRYVLGVRTNVALIISSACGYYFLAGVQTFGVEYVTAQYRIAQVVANLLLLVVGAGAVAGVLVAGGLSDALLRRGLLNSRVLVAAVAAAAAVGLFIPTAFTRSPLAALPYIAAAGFALSARDPAIDSARLDIMPAWLWGRAEGMRTMLRTAAQALAPLLFGAISDHLFGGGRTGLRWTFMVMLTPLGASALFLFRAARLYPTDVATAAAAQDAARRDPPPATGWDRLS